MNLDTKILAYCLYEKRLLISVEQEITADFFHPDYQVFYKLLVSCYKNYQEIPTPRVMMEQAGAVWIPEHDKIYSSSLELEVDPKELPHDLKEFKRRFNKNLLLKTGSKVFKENWDGNEFSSLEEANKILKNLIVEIDNIYKSKIYKEGTLSETVDDAWDSFRKVRDDPDSAKGLHVGFETFDRISNGIRPAELVLIGGESGSGKSALSMNMAVNAWKGNNIIPHDPELVGEFIEGGANIIYFTIEMPFKVLRRRLDACISGVPLYGIRDGSLDENEIQRFKAGLKFQEEYGKQFHIVDVPRGCTVHQIESKYLEKCHEFQPDLIVVDYISLMTSDKDEGSDWLSLGRLAEQMHEFCRTYNVPVISPVQLNRPPRNGHTKPDQHRVGRSSMLPQNANMLLAIETRPEEETRRDMLVRWVKNRDGEQTSFILHKQLNVMRIFDSVPGWEPNIHDGYEEINV